MKVNNIQEYALAEEIKKELDLKLKQQREEFINNFNPDEYVEYLALLKKWSKLHTLTVKISELWEKISKNNYRYPFPETEYALKYSLASLKYPTIDINTIICRIRVLSIDSKNINELKSKIQI